MDKPVFFATSQDFNHWFRKNGAIKDELIVGFYRKDSGKPSIDWPQSVDEALCFGWIDGIRRRMDDESYSIRFTPRRSGSKWSARNIQRVAILTKQGRMRAAGSKEFAKRVVGMSSKEVAELPHRKMTGKYLARIQAAPQAWKFFQTLSPSIRNLALKWVCSGKQEETRTRRLDQLIECSENQQMLPQLYQPKEPRKKK